MAPSRRDLLGMAAGFPMIGRAAPTPLFNGYDLTGWQRAGRGAWTVEDGCLAGRFDHDRPGPGYLMTEAEYSDFRLRLEFRVSTRGNSGVYVRGPQRAWGHQADQRPAHGLVTRSRSTIAIPGTRPGVSTMYMEESRTIMS